MRSNLILTTALALLTMGLCQGQNTNPFELLWRLDSGYVAPATPPPGAALTLAEVVPEPEPEAPAEVVEVPVEIPPAVTEEESPDPVVEDTLAQMADTTSQDTSQISEVVTIGAGETPSVEPEPAREKPKPVVPVEKTSPLVLVLIFGVIFSLLAWVLSLNRDLLKNVYRAALNENFSALLFREQRFATTQYLYYIIYFVFFIIGGMFLFFLGRQFGWSAWVFRSVWSCIGLVAVVYLLRHLSLNILGGTYPVSKEATQFSFSILLHNILLGIGLIPVTLFLAFGPEGMNKFVAIAGVVLCCLVYLMRQFRGLLISSSLIGGHPFHFFVYLCAVEILPLFTLIRFFHH